MPDFDLLLGARERLLAAEAAHPGSEPLRRLHARALRLVRHFQTALSLSDAQLAELSEPPQAGTNKDEE